jgi:hypothetical protein
MPAQMGEHNVLACAPADAVKKDAR